MSRAAEIVAAYVEGKSFACPHTAEEFLAMAYDDMAKRLREANAYADEIKRRYESAVESRALECVSSYRKAEIVPSPNDPTVWKARMHPVEYEFRHLSAHPFKWDEQFKYDVSRRAGDVLARVIFKALETAN